MKLMRTGKRYPLTDNKKIIHFLRHIIRNSFLILFLTISAIITSCHNPDGMDNPAGFSESGIKRWYRGNTHTHAKFSDKNDKNDIPEIAGWYKKTGYDFLIISEHNDRLAKKQVFCHDEAADPPDFLMLCGLELSKKRHLTALGIDSYIGNEKSLQDGVNKTIAAGGVPILNHPRHPVIKASDFIKTKGLNHIEVFNGNRPNQTPASEKLWDKILSSPDGRPVYAVAADDNHYKKSKVGRGWIMVDSPALTKEDIEENIREGNFYASTGIILKDYQVTEDSIKVDSKNGSLIEFIGRNGEVLKTVKGPEASYHLKGNESYVRVKITNSAGNMAWTQPVFIK
ncbi:MAG: CehA/McbA family metallohydrolase [Bacteroidia bacterium]|nr:CehA/McbA family metallohydrolase [Bacteroidia bacterium]